MTVEIPGYAAQIAGELYGGSARRDPAVARDLLHLTSRLGPARGYYYQLLSGIGWTSLPRLRRLRPPTLILAGDDDPIIPLVNARIMHRLISDSQLHVYSGGHLELAADADSIAAVVEAFLTAEGAEGPGSPLPVADFMGGARRRRHDQGRHGRHARPKAMMTPMRVVIALGGNALLERGEKPDADIQQEHVVSAVRALAPLARGHKLVVTHGNGPQVGVLALESARDPDLSRPYPFDVLGAQTQGMIGYWIVPRRPGPSGRRRPASCGPVRSRLAR
jgi:Amino acid kinase family/TAP-like protein